MPVAPRQPPLCGRDRACDGRPPRQPRRFVRPRQSQHYARRARDCRACSRRHPEFNRRFEGARQPPCADGFVDSGVRLVEPARLELPLLDPELRRDLGIVSAHLRDEPLGFSRRMNTSSSTPSGKSGERASSTTAVDDYTYDPALALSAAGVSWLKTLSHTPPRRHHNELTYIDRTSDTAPGVGRANSARYERITAESDTASIRASCNAKDATVGPSTSCSTWDF